MRVSFYLLFFPSVSHPFPMLPLALQQAAHAVLHLTETLHVGGCLSHIHVLYYSCLQVYKYFPLQLVTYYKSH